MADQYAIQDQNQFPALLGHSGTSNAAETRRIVVSDTGAVSIQGTVGVSALSGGTVDVDLLPLGGVVLTTSLAVGTTATAIPTAVLSSRKSCIVYNDGTATIYLGGSAVTTSSGLPVGTADYSPSFDLGTTILYGICSTAGGTARILEVS